LCLNVYSLCSYAQISHRAATLSTVLTVQLCINCVANAAIFGSVLEPSVDQVSGGMAQRVSIASALAGRPRVLIADEPATALDVTIQSVILDLLRTLPIETGMAIVLITHDLGVDDDLGDRVAVMYAGEIVEIANVESIFDHPAHPYTRGLIDSNPIASKRGSPLPAIPGTVPSPENWPIGCHFLDPCLHQVAECAAGPVPLMAVPGAAAHDARCICQSASKN
jgi:peptide/nickel transport system permease protein